MVFEMHIESSLMYKSILDQTKIYDPRIYDYKRQSMRPNDVVLFRSRHFFDENGKEQTVPVVIDSMHVYRSFEEMLEEISLREFGFQNGASQEEALKIIKDYYKDEESFLENSCVVAIKFCRIIHDLEELEAEYEKEIRFGPGRNVIDIR